MLLLFLDLQMVESVGGKPLCFSCDHNVVTTVSNRNNIEVHGLGVQPFWVGRACMTKQLVLMEGSHYGGFSHHGRTRKLGLTGARGWVSSPETYYQRPHFWKVLQPPKMAPPRIQTISLWGAFQTPVICLWIGPPAPDHSAGQYCSVTGSEPVFSLAEAPNLGFHRESLN